MKKFFSILLSVIILLSFAGCSNGLIGSLFGDNGSNLSEIDLTLLGKVNVIDLASNDRYTAILYSPVLNEEDYNVDEPAEIDIFLSVYDTKRDKFIAEAAVDTYTYIVDFDEDDFIRVWIHEPEGYLTENPDTYVLYDFNLKQQETGDAYPPDPYAAAEKIDTIDTNRFACYDSFAADSNGMGYDVMIFYNEPDKYYLKKESAETYISASYEKTLLECITDDSELRNINFNVVDYDSNRVINSLTVETNKDYDSVNKSKINEYCVCFDTTNIVGESEKLYIWDYNKNQTEKEIEVIEIGKNECTDYMNKIISEIDERFGVKVKMSPENDGTHFGYDWSNNQSDAKMLLCLFDLEYALNTLPDKLYSEMLCKDISDAVSVFNDFYIYLVGDITNDNVDAFADHLNDDLYIVYSCSSLTFSTFFHEMMHNMEHRIWNYETDFDWDWEQLNPDGFLYSYDDYSTVYYDNEAYQDYFMRDYGMKTELEDRATVFEAMCDAKFNDGDIWWKEKEPLVKKAELLSKAVRNSFPSFSQIDLY